MKYEFRNLSDSYDDGNIPDVDIDPYEEMDSELKQRKSNQNSSKNSYDSEEVEPLPESTRVRKDGPGGD